MRYAIAMFTAAAAMFIAIGAESVLTQQQTIDAARPVPGQIVSSEVKEVTTTDAKNRRTTGWRPVIRYIFNVEGSIIGSDRVFPLTQETSRRRAEQLVAQYPPGKQVIVYYEPRAAAPYDPTKTGPSFLVREWDFSPYLVILCAMVFLATGMGFWAAAPWRRQVTRPAKQSADGNWRELAIRAPLSSRRRPWRAAALVWYVLGGVTVGHYFVHADRPYGWDAMIAAPIYFVLGLIPVLAYLHELRFARRLRDARVWINTDRVRVGKTFNVRVEQAFRRPETVETMRVGLVCDKVERRVKGEKSVSLKGPQFEGWEDVKASEVVSADRPLQAKAKFTVPADQPATTPERQPGLPRYAWRIIVETKVAGADAYRAEFPVTVVADA